MKGEFKTTGEGVPGAEEAPADALGPTRPLRKQGDKDRARPEAPPPKEVLPEPELPKNLAEVVGIINEAVDRGKAFEKVVEELREEFVRLTASGKVKFFIPHVYISLGPVPFLSDKLVILAKRLKSNPYELPAYELGLFEGNDEQAGQLELTKSGIQERQEELAKLKEASEIVREDILGDLERGGSTAARKDLVARMLRDFQAATSEKIFKLLATRLDLERKIFEDATSAVAKVKQHFGVS